ncbi:MAG: hypothetical protein WD135_00195, partial [Ferruginibacter sp.]
MFTHTTPLLPKNKKIATWFICCCLAILSVFPIYRNFYYSNGLQTYERHRAVIEQRSEFYNPWQYRILCPYIVEGMLWVYNNTIDKIYPIERKINFSIQSTSGTTNETDQFVKLMRTPGAMKYMIIFVFFRLLQHLFIFYLAWKLWSYFVKSKWLIFLGINFLALALGNAVTVADLSFNTYMDIILYLLTANIIVFKKNKNWILPIALVAAFNRETGILIPALFFISQTDFTSFNFKKFNLKTIQFPKKSTWLVTIAAYIIFFCIFIGLRIYFGYREQQIWKVPAGLPMLKLNLLSAVGVKAYLELIGTFAVIPLIILYNFKQFPHLLKKWFLFLT